MSTPSPPRNPTPLPPGEWQLDADAPIEPDEPPAPPPPPAAARKRTAFPSRVPTPSGAAPPSPEQIVEAMLFVGGDPLTAAVACSAVRGLTAERFREAVDTLNRRYRAQNRPYFVEPRGGGFVLSVAPGTRAVRERLFGGPREARLGQPALDVLSVVAYRQPVTKPEVDAARGTDSGGVLRQLVRLGLVSVQHRGEAGQREVRYGTTPRFLGVFGLTGLDELPRLGETQPTT